MMLQTLVVALLVAGCTGYAAWTLMPSVWRRPLARGLLKIPGWPAPFAERLTNASRTAGAGCGCDGCDRAPEKSPTAGTVQIGGQGGRNDQAIVPAQAAPQPINFYPRVRP